MKTALCQLAVTSDKSQNIRNAYSMLCTAKSKGADIAILPEMFCISYRPKLFRDAAEQIPNGEAYNMLRRSADELKLSIVGGSIPEISGENLYNTCLCFDNSGELSGVYRKAHLFDVDFEGVCVTESATITAGEKPPLILDFPIRTGVSICFDIRFHEWVALARENGAKLFALPAAFSVKTGRKHWELLLRARAIDNQFFVAGVAPAASPYSYGHSMLISPDGEVLCDLGEHECVEVVDINPDDVDRMRRSIPLIRH